MAGVPLAGAELGGKQPVGDWLREEGGNREEAGNHE